MSGAVISTHTLTWSVTHYFFIVSPYIRISTHTLTWSVTGGGSGQGTAENDFNSHAHVERDSLSKIVPIIPIYFNSHAHVERDVGLQTLSKKVYKFQLTRSRGA